MGWMSLTQMKELGALITNCTCLVNDVSKVFNMYWDSCRPNGEIPPLWTREYSTNINSTNPISIKFNGNFVFNAYLSVRQLTISTLLHTDDRCCHELACTNMFRTVIAYSDPQRKKCKSFLFRLELAATTQSDRPHTRCRCNCQNHFECWQIRSYICDGLYAAHALWAKAQVSRKSLLNVGSMSVTVFAQILASDWQCYAHGIHRQPRVCKTFNLLLEPLQTIWGLLPAIAGCHIVLIS